MGGEEVLWITGKKAKITKGGGGEGDAKKLIIGKRGRGVK